MKIITKIYLLLSLSYVSTYHEDMKTFLDRCIGKCNKDYCTIKFVCRPMNRTSKYIKLDINFHPGVVLEAPIIAKMNAYKKFRTVYRPFMMTLQDEICTILMQKKHPFYKLVNQEFLDTIGNFFDPCPFSGHRYTTPQTTNIESLMFPLMPVGEWRFDTILSKIINGSEVFLGSVSMFYEIKPRGAAEF